ncbi:tRNA sulfurtransferase [Candidatus Westeberhardia cardiocondylae]|uniref:tRNA sulfurtransferase n=1 Tax=Candidatus Westeberhardia cardiocondylae TaxID=1594731 RepID=A0A0H5BWP7_9ENTR|nr:tRNA uracil 4-sulfurtransferase ThiI [Candidatus Westeberhardia cardiocondylae]CEN32125.1 tRNA sulfurtransferase [Candidatus Westeberhardia cardiocondylae]
MKFFVKFFPEIIVKSSSVRIHFTKVLFKNIQNILKYYNQSVSIIRCWDHIEIEFYNNYCDDYKRLVYLLSRIPGIHSILVVKEEYWENINDIYTKTLNMYCDILIGKTFCVRVKRRGKHDFTSQDLEKYIGYNLSKNIERACVNLTNPEHIVFLEVHNDKMFFIIDKIKGLNGFPIGTQQNVLSLISGGFDSAVSSYMLIKRGCRVHYCFFNLIKDENEYFVRKISYHLWNNFGISHVVRFISIDFCSIINEILLKIRESQIGIILKRMMIRAASKIAHQYNISALSTGEVLGQVSSQTLTNLHIIDQVSDLFIFRPLIAFNKDNIIDVARSIGTEKFSNNVPEYCGLFSKRSTVHAIESHILNEENKFDYLCFIDEAVKKAKVLDIRYVIKNLESFSKKDIVEVTNVLQHNDVILDIRSLNHKKKNLLSLVIKNHKITVKILPFYNLDSQFGKLDQSKWYLLYCDNGVMSRIQARFLYKKGFRNIKIYRPL